MITFRMSSAGRCPRALSAELLKMEAREKPVWLEIAAEEGNWHEKRLKEELISDGFKIFDEQEEVKLEYPLFQLIGHIDGKVIISTDDTPSLLEIKSMSQYQFDKWRKDGFKAFPEYAGQLTCYMEATGLGRCLYIVKNRSSGYKDTNMFLQKPLAISSILGKLYEVASAINKGELVVANFNPYSVECRRCEYQDICAPEVKELSALEGQALLDITGNWRIGRDLIKKGEAIIKEAKECLEEHTRASGQISWKFNELSIQLVQYNDSITYPKARLLEVFTEKQLEPAAEVKKGYELLRIVDLVKEEDN